MAIQKIVLYRKPKPKKTRQGHSTNRKWGKKGGKMWRTKGKKYRGQGK